MKTCSHYYWIVPAILIAACTTKENAPVKNRFARQDTANTRPVNAQESHFKLDTIKQKLSFKVGRLHLYGRIAYEINIADTTYPTATIIKLDLKPKHLVPAALLERMSSPDAGLVHFYSKAPIHKDILTDGDFVGNYRFADANLDGVPDIGVVYNGQTPNEGFTMWVNLKGRFVYWEGGSSSPVRAVGAYDKERVVAYGYHGGGGRDKETYYKIVGDTTLIPTERWRRRPGKEMGSSFVTKEKYKSGRWIRVKKIRHCSDCE